MSFFFEEEIYDGVVSYNPTGAGYAAFAVLLLLLLLLTAFLTATGKKRKSDKGSEKEESEKRVLRQTGKGAQQLAFSAMALALATVMSMLKLVELPMGGSLTLCSMFFITVIGYWFGFRTGLMTAVAYGILQLIIGPYIITPLQLLVDYIFAFGALGLAGLFANRRGGLLIGYWAGVCGRFVFAFLSGMIFFGAYAADYGMSAPLYSALYNGIYIFAEAVLTTLILLIPPVNKALKRIKNMTQAE